MQNECNSLWVYVLWRKRRKQEPFIFACLVTYTIWTALTVNLLGSSANPNWSITITSLLRPNRTKLDAIFLWLVFHASVYFIWKERNSRRHQGAWLTTETLIMHIDKSIRNRIVSLEYLGIIS